MGRADNVIDADGHMLEPVDLGDNSMDPTCRARAPRLCVETDGTDRLHIDGTIIGGPRGFGRLGAIGLRDGRVPEAMKSIESRTGGCDPYERRKDLALDGIDAAFLSPSIGRFSSASKDPDLAWTLCRASHRWLVDDCTLYPARLFPLAMLPMPSIDSAIEEMHFARKVLGMRGGFLRPNPYNERMAGDPAYEPFWTAAQELDCAIGFHEGGASGMPTVGVDRFESRGARHIISHTMEMMLVAVRVMWGGVCERYGRRRRRR